jgi:hypothetical protein
VFKNLKRDENDKGRQIYISDILAKMVHKMRVFRDGDGEQLFDTQMDIFDSDECFDSR